jgi:hypothetical protein
MYLTLICRLSDHKETELKFPYESNHKYIDKIEHKLCSDCDEWHPMTVEYFYKNKSSPDGFNPYCKQSTVRRTLEHRNKNREENLAKMREYGREYMRRPDRKLPQRENGRKMRAKGKYKEWQINNPDKIKEYNLKRSMHKKHEISDEEWFACLDYFNNSCAYCGLTEYEQYKLYSKQLHKEHVYHDGNNYIDNCVPACNLCNGSKHNFEFNDWYNEENEVFSKRRFNKIINWMTKECFKVLNLD